MKQKRNQPEAGVQYKVVELSIVDESALEDVLNEYSRQGWALDGIQFAMRESSRRPAMAFILFTRSGLADENEPRARRAVASPSRAHRRLRELAGLEDEEP